MNLLKIYLNIYVYPLRVKIINANILDRIYYIIFTWINLNLVTLNYFLKVSKLKYRFKEILLDRDLIIKNKMGLFYVRKFTTDYVLIADYYEEKTKLYFNKMKEGVFIDVGANIGKWSIFMAKKFNKKHTILAIEPLLENYDSLIKNIELNKLENVVPLQLALSDKMKDAYIVKTSINLGECFLLPDNHTPQNKNGIYKVQAKPLDEIINELNLNINEIKLLKIDVEGHEFKVFEGSKNLLNNSSDLIIIFESFEDNILSVKEFLNKFNFYIHKIEGHNYFAEKIKNDTDCKS